MSGYILERFKYVEGMDETLIVSSFGRFIATKRIGNGGQLKGTKKVSEGHYTYIKSDND